ncbi:MAG TPA: glycosyltransferase [Solirubrobacterales bacterium]|nr:glycosyltransferase [Solirubrobacterales bacterium]
MPEEGTSEVVVIVAARDEADRIAATIDALKEAFPGARVIVADDASSDGTSDLALARGAEVVSRRRPHGKGGSMTAAAATIAPLAELREPPTFLLCDGDLGASARELRRLVEAVETGECDLAVGAFSRRAGGGFGVALGFARWAIERRSGYRAGAPISGQRAMRGEVLRAVVPFAPGYGMETAMTIDAVRAGFTVREFDLDLQHRATGRSARGFAHRARQLADIARAWWARR